MRNAPDTFLTKGDAESYLVDVEADMRRGDWIDPDVGKVPFGDYAQRWVKERDLKPRSRQEYERHLRLHALPQLGGRMLNEIRPGIIRSWRTDLLEAGIGRPTVAKTYRIVKAILNTAVDDELIRRNPCRIKGASQDTADERPTATLQQVFDIAAAIQPRFRLMVLLATFAQLRFGELVALRRGNLRLESMELQVRKAIAELEDGTQIEDDPKSLAGKRWVSLPKGLQGDIELHLAKYAQSGVDGLLFVGARGAIPRRRNFNRVWKKALEEAGIREGLHLHDLRHTGSTLSASSGASLRELMARIGHSSTRAAMVYQHATRDRDHAIAAALDALIVDARREAAN